MKQIIYTCMLGIRLITSVTNPSKSTADLDLFSNALMNRAFNIVFVEPGITTRRTEPCYYVEQTDKTQQV